MGGATALKFFKHRANISSRSSLFTSGIGKNALYGCREGWQPLEDNSVSKVLKNMKSPLSCQSCSIPNPCEMLADVYKQLINMIIGMFVDQGSRLFAGSTIEGVDKQVEEACRCLNLSDDVLRNVMAALKQGMNQGVQKGTPMGVGLKMIPSYVRAIPNGTETGDYLALDLGGTNFRVLLIRLRGKEAEMVAKIYEIPSSIQRGTGDALFDHIANCIALFCEEQFGKNHKKKLPLGFTFSFPCKQDGLTRAKLIHWTKGFSASGCEGHDVVHLLRKAVKRRGDIEIDVVALLNDTVGTLMACAFKENSCQIGVIVGTGTNACYMEKLENVPKLKGQWETDGDPPMMIINMEWGAFGDDGAINFVMTEYDKMVDGNSINPTKQLFEKMISGMYMGELARCVMEKMAKKGVLFQGDAEGISKRDSFTTKHVSEVETELEEGGKEKGFPRTREILREIGVKNISNEDCLNVAYITQSVSTRAAHLTAAAIAQVLNHIKKDFVVTVGVDGSVYRFHPSFKKLLEKKITALVDSGIKFQLMLSKDGSGIGAAVVAAVATRIAHEKKSASKSRSDKS
uniref:Phosphotransferase n=1 Tax=Haemonchus contortus TaxID=6289 RepID=A0A7I4YMY3_HAECO